jgi:hypothetical protein
MLFILFTLKKSGQTLLLYNNKLLFILQIISKREIDIKNRNIINKQKYTYINKVMNSGAIIS